MKTETVTKADFVAALVALDACFVGLARFKAHRGPLRSILRNYRKAFESGQFGLYNNLIYNDLAKYYDLQWLYRTMEIFKSNDRKCPFDFWSKDRKKAYTKAIVTVRRGLTQSGIPATRNP